ncbi:hypothetical protein V6C31_02525, partial [Caldibacillus debilis]|uniref:hypothetical protein n=1 Tax=Caldibacillus debilis TaxID=301148 RepID=UPI002FDA7AA5
FDPLTNHFVTLQFFFAQWNSLLSHTDIFTEALQYDNITDEQQTSKKLLSPCIVPFIIKIKMK